MKLIGQFDSPFVRRVGIALRHYRVPFEHVGYSVFGDAEELAHFNPLRKVPTLVLDDGTALTESSLILDLLDEWADAGQWHNSATLLLPRTGPMRQSGFRLCGLAVGAMDKAVSLIYETQVRDRVFPLWKHRCEKQVADAIDVLEQAAPSTSPFLLGEQMTHADIATTCLLTCIDGALPDLAKEITPPKLRRLQRTLEAEPHFREIWQAFDIPPPKESL